MLKLLTVFLLFTYVYCDDEFLHGRILGGKDAVLGQFPHMASIRVWYDNDWRHYCGGSLITERWILTAAHCLTGLNENQVKIYLGTVTINGDGDDYDAELLLPHEEFTVRPIRNDVGLIKLTKNVSITNNVRPIRMSLDFAADGLQVIGSGFGRMENNESPTIMQYLSQTVWSNDDCDFSLQTANFTDVNLCAFNSDGKGMCNGDSGSPLIAGNYQVGIASWVRRPCGGNHPDVYVRVRDYLNWISLQVTIHS